MLLSGMPNTRKPKRPHPRSLDALFPAPKVKRCSRGHSQTPEWKKWHGCSTCKKQDAALAEMAEIYRLERQQAATAERLEWQRKLPTLPAVYDMRSTKGELQRFYPGPRRRR